MLIVEYKSFWCSHHHHHTCWTASTAMSTNPTTKKPNYTQLSWVERNRRNYANVFLKLMETQTFGCTQSAIHKVNRAYIDTFTHGKLIDQNAHTWNTDCVVSVSVSCFFFCLRRHLLGVQFRSAAGHASTLSFFRRRSIGYVLLVLHDIIPSLRRTNYTPR